MFPYDPKPSVRYSVSAFIRWALLGVVLGLAAWAVFVGAILLLYLLARVLVHSL